MAKILIAEDDPGIQTMIRILLKRDGHEAVSAEDGLKALELIKRDAFDLVLTDLRMPHVDGMYLLRAVKEREPSMPVIVLTAYATRETAIEALKFGAFDYIAKPFTISELMTTVERALNSGRDKTRGADMHS